jgi:UDP-N-acetylmuramoyl-tripeptide--D-alanyl-D-alanine ligase
MAFRGSLGQLTEILAVPHLLKGAPLNIDLKQAPNLIATRITTDSRDIQPGDVFVALRGDRFDGHTFVRQAIAQGAIAAVVDQAVDQSTDLDDLPLFVVTNTLTAYQAIARWWRDQFPIPVIGITGSVGKTTTKELIAAVLATQGSVLKTQANNNNEIGVPKTLLELTPDHDFAVIEMGMRAAGEIAELTRIANPTVGVITNVGTAHIGRLGSEQAIADAKCELLAEMGEGAIAVLNHDNARLLETSSHVWNGKRIDYGLEAGSLTGHLSADGKTLTVNGIDLPVPLTGQHNALNYLAALGVARAIGIDWTGLTRALTQGLQVELPKGRAQRIQLPNDIVLLDETYNAGLESMLASLKLLAETPGTRHLAVLGTMKELGDRSPEFHRQVGEMAQTLKLDYLLILADEAESRAMAEGAGAMAVEQCQSHEAVVKRLQAIVAEGDRILFKASRAVGLDRVVELFLQH